MFGDIGEWVYEKSGIEIPHDSLEFEAYENPRGEISMQGKVAYKGSMQRRGNNATIKLDLSADEILVEQPIKKKMHHPCSDLDKDDFLIQTYCIEEIFAEKLRDLVERMRPRDLYAVIHLHKDDRWQPNRELLQSILKKKCEFKSVAMPTMKIVNALPSKQDLDADWQDMLGHQISGLDPLEYYWRQLPAVFKWLYFT